MQVDRIWIWQRNPIKQRGVSPDCLTSLAPLLIIHIEACLFLRPLIILDLPTTCHR